MPTSFSVDKYAPFPDDVEIVELPRLSHAKLLSDDGRESSALFKASKEHGFFLLDLSDTVEGSSLLTDLDKAFEIGRTFFNLNLESKEDFKVNSGNVG